MSKRYIRIGILIAALLTPLVASATPYLGPYCGNLAGCNSDPTGLFTRIANLTYSRLELYGYILGALFIIIGGVRMITSLGNEEKFNAGKTTIIWALVGLFVANFGTLLFTFVFEEISSVGGGDLVIAVIKLIRSTIVDMLYITLLGVGLFSGMTFVLAQGKDDQAKNARNALIFAAIGAIIVNLADRFISAFVLL